jgi:N-acetylmuramoyl-L-alanine amidase
MPSILHGNGFHLLTRRKKPLLDNPAWREKVAKGMAQGVANYVERYGVRK